MIIGTLDTPITHTILCWLSYAARMRNTPRMKRHKWLNVNSGCGDGGGGAVDVAAAAVE